MRRGTDIARLAAVLLGLLAAGCGSGEGSESPSEPRPDVVLFVIDTLRADRLGCYGYERDTSPSIDRLAKEGVLFEDASAQGSLTAVSMSSMMTGRYLTAYRLQYEPGVPTLAEVFRAAGYRTVGITGNQVLSSSEGFDRGFEHYDDRTAAAGQPTRSRPIDVLADHLWPVLERALEPEGDAPRPPVFLYVHVMDPHSPYLRRAEYADLLPLDAARALGPPGRHREVFAARGAPAADDDPGWERAWANIRAGRGRYDHDVRYTDEQLGAMLARLEQLGLLAHGILVLAADHGEGLWDQVAGGRAQAERSPATFFFQEHGNRLFGELVHTPLLVRGAGVPRGVRVSAAVENVDVFPTLLELAGLDAPDTLHGESLVPLMHGEPGGWSKDVHAVARETVSFRESTSGLKLVWPTARGEARGRTPGLFDLDADPGERDNLFDARPDDVARLRTRLEAWLARYPVESSEGRKQSQETIDTLRALGYADHVMEDDAGEDE